MNEQTALARWRGFNLLEMFTTRSDGAWREDDFRWIADWGFDFVRLPMCYLLWIEGDDVFRPKEAMLANVDRAVRLGERHGLHVCLNFHRGPGYSVNAERKEPFDLWKDQAALDAFCFHWQLMARRYKGVPSERLSFNLINEPPAESPARMTRADHERVVRAAVAAIRAVDPGRLIIADGISWGNVPCPELADLGIAQSCRAYAPMGISHYKAHWVNVSDWSEPVWPGLAHRGETWDRARLEQHYAPWAALARQGVGVHCGEGGAFKHTPHDVVLAWLRDVLGILTSHGIGLALWNFRGSFGILDSDRAGVAYADWHGHRLDRALLELLQEF
ncbi:MAG TPA: cellulase family glycosylhydrolase [Planctomycetota bacterium]|nr:cellulase family glycosylhydrolase [Planctomycetota bacterium]